MTPQEIIDAVRIVELLTDRTYLDDDELERLGPAVNAARKRYDELKRGCFRRAALIMKAEALARHLNEDTAGIREEIEKQWKRRREAEDAQLLAEVEYQFGNDKGKNND